jgi:hypothetical protein
VRCPLQDAAVESATRVRSESYTPVRGRSTAPLLSSRTARVSSVYTLDRHARGVHTSAAASTSGRDATAAGAPGTGSAEERPVFVKVGDTGKYVDWSIKWADLKDLRAGDLLKALKADDLFALDFKDVKLSACTVAVVKNAALDAAGVDEPSVEHETGDNVEELKLAKTVGSVAGSSGRSDKPGAPLFICVRKAGSTPGAAMAGAHIGVAWGCAQHASSWALFDALTALCLNVYVCRCACSPEGES